MGKILYNKNTLHDSGVSALFDSVLYSGEIVLNNDNDNPSLWMSKQNEERVKINSAKTVKMDENLSSLSGTIVASDSVHDAISKIKNNTYTKDEIDGTFITSADTSAAAKKLDHEVTMSLSGEVNGSVTTDFSTNEVVTNTYKTFTTVSNVNNIDFNDYLTIVNLTNDATLTVATDSLVSLPNNAVRKRAILIKNNGSSKITVTIGSDSRVIPVEDTSISIEPGEYGKMGAFVTNTNDNYTIYMFAKEDSSVIDNFFLTYNGQRYNNTLTLDTFSETGGTDNFTVTSDKPWTVTSQPSWMTLNVESGSTGDTMVVIAVPSNTGTTEKTGTIVLTTDDNTKTITVYCSQDSINPSIKIDDSSEDVAVSSSFRDTSNTFVIKARGGWNLEITGGTTNVVSVTDTNYTETSLVVTYPVNGSTASTNTITVVLTNITDNTLKRTITITQSEQSYITFTRNGANTNYIPYNGEVGTINVSTNLTGYAYEESSQVALSKTLGLVNNDVITYTAQTITASDTATSVSFNVTAQTTDYSATDGIAQNIYTYTYELYPYINASNVTVNSASTTGNLSFDSNYSVTTASTTSQKLTNISISNNVVSFTINEDSDWVDQTYNLVLKTEGTIGPAIEKTVVITRSAKVAFLNVSDVTVGKEAGNPTTQILNAISTNDTYTMVVTSGGDWLTYSNNQFTMTENTGDTDRTATITVTSTHNDGTGNPVVKTITLTQEAVPTTDENITVNLDFKQNSGGTWFVKTSTSNSSLNFPITLTYASDSFNTTVNSSNYVQTPFTTAVGTQINTTNIGGTPSYTDGTTHIRYNITYFVSSNVAYTETVTDITPTDVRLWYSDTSFSANGSASTSSQYSTPGYFVVEYTEDVTNSFDGTTKSVSKTQSGLENVVGLNATTQYGGKVVDTYNVGAASRGTTIGDSQTVVTITGVEYKIDDETFTTPLDTPIVFTQDANSAGSPVLTESSVTRSEGSSQTYYTDINFKVSRDDTNNQGFDAAGNVIGKSYSTIDVDVTESGKTYTATTYNYTSTSAYTVTYTSGAKSAYTETDTWQDTESTTPVNYSNRASYSGKSSASWATVTTTSGVQKVSADSRGTTTGTSRSVNLYYKSTHDSSKGTTVTIPQAANSITGSTEVVDSVTSSITSSQVVSSNTEYSNVYVWFDVDGSTTLPASGGSVTIDAYESGRTRTVTVTQNKWNEKTTKHTVRRYSSGAESSTSPTTTTTSSWTTYNTTTGSEISYGPIDITSRVTKSGNSNITWSSGTVSAGSRGTTTGSSQTATLSVTSEHKSTATASATVTREANEIVGERWIDIRSGVEISAASVSNCYLIVSPNTFSARTGTMSTTITVKSAVDTTRITGVTADRYDVYTSNASAKTGDDIIVSANTVNSHVAVRPSTGWTTSPTYSITISSPSVNGSAYTYTATTSTVSNPPTSTVSNGVLKFSNPSGTCTGQTAFAYSGTPAPVEPVYPTVVVTSLQANEQYGCSGVFQFTNSGRDATPNATWEFIVSLEFVPFDGYTNVTITGKTSSDGYGLSTIGIKEVSGSHSSEEFTIKKIGTTQFQCYITTPAAYLSSIVNSYTQPDSITS